MKAGARLELGDTQVWAGDLWASVQGTRCDPWVAGWGGALRGTPFTRVTPFRWSGPQRAELRTCC